jgi:hypothetical protein
MHLILLVLRLVLGIVAPEWRDSLTLAARADGRIEYLPHRPGLWGRWLSWTLRSSWHRKRDARLRAGRATCSMRRFTAAEPETPC